MAKSKRKSPASAGQMSFLPPVSQKETLLAQASKPLRGGNAACDVGLFSNDHHQTDLVVVVREAHAAPLYASPPMRIGRHEWRICVVPSTWDHGRYATRYEWRRASAWRPEEGWRWDQFWPSYNQHDTYSGLPRSLRKLWVSQLAALHSYGMALDHHPAGT